MTHKNRQTVFVKYTEKPREDQSYFILMSSSPSIRTELKSHYLFRYIYILQGRATKQCCINFLAMYRFVANSKAQVACRSDDHPSLPFLWLLEMTCLKKKLFRQAKMIFLLYMSNTCITADMAWYGTLHVNCLTSSPLNQ